LVLLLEQIVRTPANAAIHRAALSTFPTCWTVVRPRWLDNQPAHRWLREIVTVVSNGFCAN